MKSFKIDFTKANDFVTAWLLDANANSAHKGVQTNAMKGADVLSEARKIRSGDYPNAEFSQSKLNRLALRLAMHEEQEAAFQVVLDSSSKAWCAVTGKKAWAPYSAGNATPQNATATNAFFDQRLG
jgi:hypothetical protein